MLAAMILPSGGVHFAGCRTAPVLVNMKRVLVIVSGMNLAVIFEILEVMYE